MGRHNATGRARPTRRASEALGDLRASKRAEEARAEQSEAKRIRRKARAEFAAWKRAMCDLVARESKLEINEGDGSWRFLVPPRLVKFVFAVMVKEYLAANPGADEGQAKEALLADIHKRACVEKARGGPQGKPMSQGGDHGPV